MLRFLPPLSQIGLVVGAVLTLVGFWAYAEGNSTLNLVGFFYGVPILLGGAALKAAELKPVPYDPPTPPELVALRDRQATSTQQQVRKDVTRFRYGQQAHLDLALAKLGLAPTDEERPVLTWIREVAIADQYALVLGFASPLMPFETWEAKREKIERFFGPGVIAQVAQPAEKQVVLTLVTADSAAATAAATTPSEPSATAEDATT
jgi:hypothetical protein